MYTISYSRATLKTLRRIPADTARLIRSKLTELSAAPSTMRNVKKLTGSPGYRLRVGGWRVVYTIDHGRLVVAVIKIDSRGGVYK